MGTMRDESGPRDGARMHQGGCACGAVRYELQLEPCRDHNAGPPSELRVRARAFKLLAGEQCLSGHQFAPSRVHLFYCELCGVCSFSRHDVEQAERAYYAVDLRCLDLPRVCRA